LTGSDHFGDSITVPAGSSKIEPGITPAYSLTLSWKTFTNAASEVGASRRYGGIHFARADLAGTQSGRLIAAKEWTKGQSKEQQSDPFSLK
jgi:hypothetical protein